MTNNLVKIVNQEVFSTGLDKYHYYFMTSIVEMLCSYWSLDKQIFTLPHLEQLSQTVKQLKKAPALKN